MTERDGGVKASYRFAEWVERTREVHRDIRHFVIHSDALQGYELQEHEDLPPSERQRRIVRYIFNPAGEDARRRLIVTVFECHSVRDAHETLIDVVARYMAPYLPRCETKGLEVGDICFGSHGPVSLNVIFARFNILVELKSTSLEGPEVDDLARGIDWLILKWSEGF